jgi:hypothetical protein
LSGRNGSTPAVHTALLPALPPGDVSTPGTLFAGIKQEEVMDANVLNGSNKWPKRFGTMPGMTAPASKEADLRELRLRYNAAYTAYQSCVMALNEAAISGREPAATLLQNEAKALRELGEARGQFLAAMARARH